MDTDALTDRLLAATDRLLAATERIVATLTGGPIDAFDDREIVSFLGDITAARNALDVLAARAAQVVERRSVRELGAAGLAQRTGHRNATALLQTLTGLSRADVGRALRTGADLADASQPPARASTVEDAAPSTGLWRETLYAALERGGLGQAQFQAIRVGLGEPPVDRYPDLDPCFLSHAWANAVDRLIEEAPHLPVEDLRVAARIARDRLDPVGVTLRFEERFAARSYRSWVDEHGQHHARVVFDDDAAAWVDGILQAALRPRRGPRFVAVDSREGPSEPPAVDSRSNEQIAYDTLVAVLRTGAAADPAQAFGDRQPGVRIVVEASAMDDAEEVVAVVGVGHLEDGGTAVPGGVVESYLCDSGSLAVTVDSATGRPLDVGRHQRLFTRKQRIAIGVREGGCIGVGCSAPVSQCEIHHIDHWAEHRGRTDVDDGVPLCRNHHLGLHNRGERITRERDPVSGRDVYWLHAPPDPVTGEVPAPRRLVSRSPRRFRAA